MVLLSSWDDIAMLCCTPVGASVSFEELRFRYTENPLTYSDRGPDEATKSEEDPNWQLLFRATRDSFDATVFHRFCDAMGPTVTVARVARFSDRIKTPQESGDGMM